MKFTDYLNEGDVSNELGITVDWEFPEGYSIVLDAKSTKDAMQALQTVEKYGDKHLTDEDGDILDPDGILDGFKKMLKNYGKVRMED